MDRTRDTTAARLANQRRGTERRVADLADRPPEAFSEEALAGLTALVARLGLGVRRPPPELTITPAPDDRLPRRAAYLNALAEEARTESQGPTHTGMRGRRYGKIL